MVVMSVGVCVCMCRVIPSRANYNIKYIEVKIMFSQLAQFFISPLEFTTHADLILKIKCSRNVCVGVFIRMQVYALYVQINI